MNTAAASSVEIPSGKDEAYENFPVGSWLLPARLRPHIAVFYRFARAIDDIADSNVIAADEKAERLNGFAEAIQGKNKSDVTFETAHRMRESLEETGISPRHCLDLIEAFIRDTTKLRYTDWDDLIGYCLLSASPVGRYLLDLHGEDPSGHDYADALCNALQVINHLQDCKDDYLTLDRVYIPEPWLVENGASVADLDAASSSTAVRQAIDRTLDQVDQLMPMARTLPQILSDRRLAMESAVIVRIADRLIEKFRHGDPLAQRIQLSKFAYLSCFARGAASVWMPRHTVREGTPGHA